MGSPRFYYILNIEVIAL